MVPFFQLLKHVLFMELLVFCSVIQLGHATLAQAQSTCRNDIYFGFDSYSLTEEAKQILRCHADSLTSNSERSLRLEGHNDERGTPDYAIILGEKRARSAKRYVVEELGVSKDRVVITSYGKERPVCKKHTSACRAQNRRVHVVVLEPPQ